MISKEDLIAAIQNHLPSSFPNGVSVQEIMEELNITNPSQMLNALEELKDDGSLTYEYANNKVKRIILNDSFPR